MTFQVLIVVGETGSGKTTQLTQYIAEAGFTMRGKIGCTQPRRVAAQSVAERVNIERGFPARINPKNSDTGYCIRFDDKSDTFRTKIRYMTDGMLVRESMQSKTFNRYSVVVLDEAHERNINTDPSGAKTGPPSQA